MIKEEKEATNNIRKKIVKINKKINKMKKVIKQLSKKSLVAPENKKDIIKKQIVKVRKAIKIEKKKLKSFKKIIQDMKNDEPIIKQPLSKEAK